MEHILHFTSGMLYPLLKEKYVPREVKVIIFTTTSSDTCTGHAMK